MKILSSKVVGTPTKTAWAQVHTFTPSDEEKRRLRGQLIAAVSVSELSDEVDAVQLGREIINRLQEEYFGNEEGSAFERLKEAVRKVYKEFSEAKLEIAAVSVWKKYIYLCAVGGGRAALWRDGQLHFVLSTGEGDFDAASGKLSVRDVLIFGTDAFFRTTATSLSEVLEKSTAPQDIADSIAPLTHSKRLPSLAAAFVKTEVKLPAGAVTSAQTPIQGVKGALRELLVNLAKRLPEKAAPVKQDKASRRTAVSVGLILLLLLVLSIGIGLRQKNIREYRSSYEDRLIQAESLYSDALLQREINPSQARQLFLDAKTLVEQLVAEGVSDKRLDELKTKIEESTVSVLGVVEAQPSTFLDLSLVRAEVSARELVFDDGVLAILDQTGDRIISVSADKQTEVIAGGESLGKAQNATLYSGRYFTFGEKGIIEAQRRGASRVVVEPDEEWGEIIAVEAFGANLYLLDRRGEIWRYPGIEGGFGSRQRWLGEGVEPDFSLVVDMAIDGSIWVLSSSGRMLKFTRGAPEAVNIKGLDKEFSNPRAVYTDENLDSFFILDSGNARIVEVSKEKEYQKQYLWEGMGEVRDIAVSREAGKIFLLAETKILELPLR